MSLNEEKDEEHWNQLAIPREIQDELAYVIHTSLNNIATQINLLNKYAEDLLGELSNEVDRTSFRVKALEKRIIRLTAGITLKGSSEEMSLQATKSKKTIQSTTIQAQLSNSSDPLPLKMFETQEASVQTSFLNMPTLYCQDGTESLKISPDASYCSELCKESIALESKEQKGGKLKQKKKHIGHSSEPESEPQCQLTEVDVLVEHISAACGKASHSYVDQPAVNSFSTFQFSEISKLLTRAVGKVLSRPLHLPMHGAGDLKNSLNYVNYGTGVGEELQPQPRRCLKTEVFVSPTAPNPPPPLPPDWLVLLRSSKTANPSPIIPFPTPPSPALRTPTATSPPDCMQATPEAALPITPPKADISPPVPEPYQHYELTPDNLLSHGKDQEMPPPLSPLVTSPSIQLKTTVIPPRPSAFPSTKSSFTQQRRPLAAKSPRSSVSPVLNKYPSTIPIITKARSILMESIRKGILPHKTKNQCVPKAKTEIPKNEASCIPIHHKAMGYTFGKGDSGIDWME
uniref:Uncharacterized protein n=1 Tax=Otolemur garnettii TaxID=30611 RepID=H0XSY9_OTOGA